MEFNKTVPHFLIKGAAGIIDGEIQVYTSHTEILEPTALLSL